MKKITALFAAILLLAGFVSAQNVEVPANVLEKFTADYPGAQDAKWEKEGDTFEVEFVDGENMEVAYDKNGEVLEVEVEIPLRDMPGEIEDALEALGDLEPEEVSRVEKGGTTYYELEFMMWMKTNESISKA